jgi:O-antigen/teichoic acid export membrane protein
MWKRNLRAGRQGDTRWILLTLGALATAATQSGIVWVLARTADPAVTGIYGLAMAWLTPIFALCGLQLRPLLATEARARDTMTAYRILRVLGISAAMGSVGLVAVTYGAYDGFSLVLLAATIPRFAEMAADFQYGIQMRRSEFSQVGVSQLTRAACTVLVFSALWHVTTNLAVSLCAAGAAALAVVCMMDWQTQTNSGDKSARVCSRDEDHKRVLANRNTRDELRGTEQSPGVLPAWKELANAIASSQCQVATLHLLGIAGPLALIALLNQATASVPRLLLGQYGRLPELASFTCLMSLLAIPSLLSATYVSAQAPRFADAFAQGGFSALHKVASRAVGRVLLLAFGTTLLLVLIGNLGLQTIFGPQYSVSPMAMAGVGLFAAAWSASTVFGTASTASRQVKPQVVGFSLSLAVCALCGWLWIPSWGISGAAWSMCAAGIVLVGTYLISFCLLVRRHKHDLSPAAYGLDRSTTLPAPSHQSAPLDSVCSCPVPDADSSPRRHQGVDIHVHQTS